MTNRRYTDAGVAIATNEERRAINESITTLTPGTVVRLATTKDIVRTLTVTDTECVPDWSARQIGTNEYGVVLEGYGTTYSLIGYQNDRIEWAPDIRYESNTIHGNGVWSLEVFERSNYDISEHVSDPHLFPKINPENL